MRSACWVPSFDWWIICSLKAPRILFMRAFARYFEGKPSGLNPVNIIRATQEFIDLRQRINDTIQNDFKAANEYVKVMVICNNKSDWQIVVELRPSWLPKP
ncbi:unnamed protein product [Ostreobium quekettii]|uniref:Uncharacterized protein n=1 Tax=Ostreobium quekettii TaxID=121088 RepID=A0A8S1JDJ9_9CHLO|nr:unnamed protein product [Ostreobium quekettii]